MQTTPWSEYSLQRQLTEMRAENNMLKQTVFDLSKGRVVGGGGGGYDPSSVPSSAQSAPTAVNDMMATMSKQRSGQPHSHQQPTRSHQQRTALSASRVRSTSTLNHNGGGARSNKSNNTNSRPQQQQRSLLSSVVDNTTSIADRQRRRAQLSNLYGGDGGGGGGGPTSAHGNVGTPRRANSGNTKQAMGKPNSNGGGMGLISQSVFSGTDTTELSHQLRNELFGAAVGGPTSTSSQQQHPYYGNAPSTNITHVNNNQQQRQHRPSNPKSEILRQLAENGERLAAMLSGEPLVPQATTTQQPQMGGGGGRGGELQNLHHYDQYSTNDDPNNNDDEQQRLAWEQERMNTMRRREEAAVKEAAEGPKVDIFTRLTYQPTGNLKRSLQQQELLATSSSSKRFTYEPRPNRDKAFDVGAAIAIPSDIHDHRAASIPIPPPTIVDGQPLTAIDDHMVDPVALFSHGQYQSMQPQPHYSNTATHHSAPLLPAAVIKMDGGSVGLPPPPPTIGEAQQPMLSSRRHHPSQYMQQNYHRNDTASDAYQNLVDNAELMMTTSGTTTTAVALHHQHPPQQQPPPPRPPSPGTVYRKLPYYAKHDPYFRPPPQQQQQQHAASTTRRTSSNNATNNANDNATNPLLAATRYYNGTTAQNGGGGGGGASVVRLPTTAHPYGEMVVNGVGTHVTPVEYLDAMRNASRIATLQSIGGGAAHHHDHDHHVAESNNHNRIAPLNVAQITTHRADPHQHPNLHSNSNLYDEPTPPRVAVAIPWDRPYPIVPDSDEGGVDTTKDNGGGALSAAADSNGSTDGGRRPTIVPHLNPSSLLQGNGVDGGGNVKDSSSKPPLPTPTSTTHLNNTTTATNNNNAFRPPSNSNVYSALMGEKGSAAMNGRVGSGGGYGSGLTSLRLTRGGNLGSGEKTPTSSKNNKRDLVDEYPIASALSPHHDFPRHTLGAGGGGLGDTYNNRPMTGNSTVSMGSLDGTGRMKDLLSWANHL